MTTPTTAEVGRGCIESTVVEIDGFRGRLISADHAGYNIARAVLNGAINRRPLLIARCSGSADVAAAVRFAREHDLEIAIRGGYFGVVTHFSSRRIS
jgi:FAD/FMN-containing dehydrogenase